MFGMVCCQYKPPLYLAPFGRNLRCKFLTGDCKPPVWEKEMVVEGLEMSPPSSLVVTSYRLPIVTIGLSLTIFPVLRHVTDGRTDGRTKLV